MPKGDWLVVDPPNAGGLVTPLPNGIDPPAENGVCAAPPPNVPNVEELGAVVVDPVNGDGVGAIIDPPPNAD